MKSHRCRASTPGLALAALGAALSVGAACAPGHAETREIEKARVVEPARPVRFDASSAERFPLPEMGGTGGTAAPAGLRWSAPDDWEPSPERPMRLVGFEVGGGAECTVTVLPGDAGGTLANVNRWHEQMGRGPIPTGELERLGRVAMLGGEAVLVDVEGIFRGMGGEPLPGARLLGAIRPLEGRTVFVKMTGPAEVVAAEREAFLAFCSSLEEDAAR